MIYQENGRFGRITKNMRKQGFKDKMELVLFDSREFNTLNKITQTKYIETVMCRMTAEIGSANTNAVLFQCGSQCCGKSWSSFVTKIWVASKDIDDFFINLNNEEEKYHTKISYCKKENMITVIREKCICGLINKGNHFVENKTFCNCSIGHMDKFFANIFKIKKTRLKQSIFNGDKKCEWSIYLNNDSCNDILKKRE